MASQVLRRKMGHYQRQTGKGVRNSTPLMSNLPFDSVVSQ